MKINNPGKPKFPLIAHNKIEMINHIRNLEKLGYRWNNAIIGENWRTDFNWEIYAIKFEPYNDMEKVVKIARYYED